MTEAEFQQRAREFVKQLEHYPEVGKRPFGYPKGAWLMSGAWALIGGLLQLPLLLTDILDRKAVLASVAGSFLLGCAFTMRVVAFSSAVSGAMDMWLCRRIEAIEAEGIKGTRG
jgi:hypothetical protein